MNIKLKLPFVDKFMKNIVNENEKIIKMQRLVNKHVTVEEGNN